MKVQLLPSSFERSGDLSQHQRLTCFVVNDSLAIDAGSLAFSCTNEHRKKIRDIVVSHTHLDHIAGLPIFIDDLFAGLTDPIRLHVTKEMADVFERDVFNWDIYPRFSELANDHGPVMEYHYFRPGRNFIAAGLEITPVLVNHNKPSAGFLISDSDCSIGITGDTAETESIWQVFSSRDDLKAIIVECAFPDEFESLAIRSYHFTPSRLAKELAKLENKGCPIYVSNIKAMYRDRVLAQIAELAMPNLHILEVGEVYEF